MSRLNDEVGSDAPDFTVSKHYIIADNETQVFGTFTVKAGATVTVESGGTLIVGTLVDDGTVDVQGTLIATDNTLAAGDTSPRYPIRVNNADTVSAYIDDGSANPPADVTVVLERYSPLEDRWMEFGRNTQTSNTTPVSITGPAIPSKMGYKIINETSSEISYRIRVVSG